MRLRPRCCILLLAEQQKHKRCGARHESKSCFKILFLAFPPGGFDDDKKYSTNFEIFLLIDERHDTHERAGAAGEL